jgi:hypothetical protein
MQEHASSEVLDMCNECFVTTAMKSRIAAHGAAFRRATQSPFGSDDEIGMLNLIDATSRQTVMDRADPSRVYDLSVDNFVGMPGWFGAEDQPYQIWMTHTPRGEEADDVVRVGKAANELVSYSGDSISMYTHTGTHIDALNHFGYAEFSAAFLLTSTSAVAPGGRPAWTSIRPL